MKTKRDYNVVVFGVSCQRGAGSMFGPATRWLEKDGVLFECDTLAEAQAEEKRLNKMTESINLTYYAKQMFGPTS